MAPSPKDWRGAWTCGALAALIGALLSVVPLGSALWRTSYDWPLLGSSPTILPNPVIIHIDDASLRALKVRPDGTLDRRWYAALLKKLTADGARAAVFDLSLARADATDEGDRLFAQALRESGHTVLAATLEIQSWGSAVQRTLRPPAEMFATNAFAIGRAMLEVDKDGVVRRMNSDGESLPLVTAKTAEAIPREFEAAAGERWLRHYLPRTAVGSAFETVSLQSAVASNGVPEKFFRDKVVFVGSRRDVGPAGELRDRFATPFSAWDERHAAQPGVLLHATAYANIARGEWLVALTPAQAMLFVALCGTGLALLLCPRRRGMAVLLFLGAAAALAAGGFFLQQQLGLVAPWLIPLAVQLPIALIWTLGRNSNLPGRPEVFISYRRTEGEGSGYALGMYHALRARGVESHWDMVSIDSGRWKEQLGRHIDEVPNFILLVTNGSLNPERLNRPDGKEDMFRWEIERAHRRHKNIILVLIDGAKIPPPSEPLPDSLAWLQQQDNQPQTWTFRHDDAMRLVELIWPRLRRRSILPRLGGRALRRRRVKPELSRTP